MNLSQIATILNNELVPNITGATQVAETLDNLVDFGKSASTLSQNDLLDLKNKFVSAVARTEFDTRALKKNGLGFRRTKEDFAGCIQRVKMDLMKAEDTDIYNLQKNKTYNRGQKWDGYNMDNKIFTESTAFRIVHQIPLKDFISAINSKTSMTSFVALIESTVRNTMNIEEYAMEIAMLVAGIANNSKNEVKLVTMYNALKGGNLNADTAQDDYEFLQWSTGAIIEMIKYLTDPNKKYNDGTITTFVPESDIRVTMLSKFDTKLKTHLLAPTFNDNYLTLKVDNTINSWCGVGESLFPTFADVSKINCTIDKGGVSTPVQIENCIGCIYDYDGYAWCEEDMTITSDWNGDGAFSTIYENHLGKKIVDPRNTTVFFTLN